ncbi:MAG: hypothetical protein L6R40_004784 [Gallowayella cf. fulva]|nr:MAG: hypothetical protein L6R40_004784 [Xanthomendoza cf. fulva]
MPPPAKRRRLTACQEGDIEKANAELQKKRSRSEKKLKSNFEAIFEKYSRDFTGIGDVIDFENDTVIVNNGHVENMVDEKDPGRTYEESEVDADDDGGDDEEESEDKEQGNDGEEGDEGEEEEDPDSRQAERVIPDSQDIESSDDDPLGILEDVFSNTASRICQRGKMSLPPNMNNGRKRSKPNGFRPSIASMVKQNQTGVEEAWRYPLLPADMNVQRASPSPAPSVYGDSDSPRPASPPGVSIWALPKGSSKALESSPSHPPHGMPSKSSKPPHTPWTQDERQLLYRLKTSNEPWIEIQRKIPNRTLGALHVQWYALRERLDQEPTRSDNPPSQASSYQSVKKVRGRPRTQAENVSDQPIQNAPSDGLAAPSYPGSNIAELEANVVSLSEKCSGMNEVSPSHDLEPQSFPPDTVVPDSQDVIEAQRLPDKEYVLQIDAEGFSSCQAPEGENHSALAQDSTQLGTFSCPVLLVSSPENSPDETVNPPQLHPVDGTCRLKRNKYGDILPKARPPPPASANYIAQDDHDLDSLQEPSQDRLPVSASIEPIPAPPLTAPGAEDLSRRSTIRDQAQDVANGPESKRATTVALSDEHPRSQCSIDKGRVNGTKSVFEQLTTSLTQTNGMLSRVDNSKTTSLQPDSSEGQVNISGTRNTPTQNRDLGMDHTVSCDLNFSRNINQPSEGSEDPSEARRLPAAARDILPGGPPPANPTAADNVGRPRFISQRFDRVEIPIARSSHSAIPLRESAIPPAIPPKEPPKSIVSLPRELGTIAISPARDVTAVPVTPPRELLPAQEESLRKIKPFSLILPIDSNSTTRSPECSKSSYLQSLDLKYRLSLDPIPSNVVSPSLRTTLVEQPATEGIRSPQPPMNPVSVRVEEQESMKSSSPLGARIRIDSSPSENTPDLGQISDPVGDADELSIQTLGPLTLRGNRRLASSGNKQRVAPRLAVADDDSSDDELSTPIKTPARVLMKPSRAFWVSE